MGMLDYDYKGTLERNGLYFPEVKGHMFAKRCANFIKRTLSKIKWGDTGTDSSRK